MKETFGEFIHNLRINAGMTLTKLGAALDIDQSTLSKIENEKRVAPEEILPKLANVFKLDLSELRKEYYSEKIADILYDQDDISEVLKLAERKVEYLKIKLTKQGKLDLNDDENTGVSR